MNTDLSHIQAALQSVLQHQLPRILTQACRDTNNPAYGCFDRNWWHYRIRDFASIILQQGGYAVWEARGLCPTDLLPESFARSIARGACLLWNKRACLHGAFEEYYPWEQGYPPVAFSTLAIAKLAAQGIVEPNAIRPGLAIAARQLATRFEDKAANQQVAGLAALAWVRTIAPDLVPDDAYRAQRDRTLALQTNEGWYWEYDGPDLGYLAVTIDCLWDLFDATREECYRASAHRALDFLHTTLCLPNHGLGMLNARNTDYVVPYGIARFAAQGTPDEAAQATRLLALLFSDTDSPKHFFSAIDDRYWCHYIGHSVARAARILQGVSASPTPADFPRSVSLPLCGYEFATLPDGSVATLALKKGGCVRLSRDGSACYDFGWIVDTGKKQYVSHWWSQAWTLSHSGPSWTLSGPLVAHKEPESKPFMHIALRILSFVFGKALISLLKKVMIFKKAQSPYAFQRTISVEGDTLVLRDTISGCTGSESFLPAPRASKRHVASADSFHTEDFDLSGPTVIRRESSLSGDTFTATTRLRTHA